MRQARSCAREAASSGDVPIGAVVLDADGTVVGTGVNAPTWLTPSTNTMQVDYVRGWA